MPTDFRVVLPARESILRKLVHMSLALMFASLVETTISVGTLLFRKVGFLYFSLTSHRRNSYVTD